MNDRLFAYYMATTTKSVGRLRESLVLRTLTLTLDGNKKKVRWW